MSRFEALFLFIYLIDKMEKEQILSTINEKLTAEGIKTEPYQRTLGDYLNENLPAEGTEPDDAYFDRHVRIFKSIAGQVNHVVATQVEDFKKNYKPEIKNDPPEPNPEPNKEVEELKRTVADLSKRLDEKESKQTQEQLMSQLKAEMKKLGAADDYVLRQTLRGVTLDTKKSVSDLAKEYMTAYDSELTACRGKGAAPRNGNPNAGGDKGKTLADAYWEKKARKKGNVKQ